MKLYHERLPTLQKAKVMTADRQRAMRKRWAWVLSSNKTDGTRRATTADEALSWFAGYFAKAAENDWLMGRTPRSLGHTTWKPSLDFLMADKGLKHVIEHTTEAA